MKVTNIRVITGPNIYSHSPVLVMTLGLGELAGRDSNEFPAFIERLVNALPGVHEHYCGLGRRGGFVERLYGGTYFGHIVEHVALELSDSLGISVNRGKTISSGRPGEYLVAVEYKSEAGMRELLKIAVDLVQALLDDVSFDLDGRLEAARKVMAQCDLGPSTRAIADAAGARNIPWKRLDEASLLALGYGKYRKYAAATITSETRSVGVDIAANKHLTKELLLKAELPAPQGSIVASADEAVAAFTRVGAPVVLKPLDGNQGKGVSLNLNSADDVEEAFHLASRYSSRSIVEELLSGRDYRVVVVGGRVVAASERRPAEVTGDGIHRLRELIEIENRNPLRGDGHEKPLTMIHIDDAMIAHLRRTNLGLDDVPAAGRVVALRQTANLSTGGTACDATDLLHPRIRRDCERAARVIGLDVCGLDVIVPDISQPWTDRSGIVEVNAAPGIRMHHHPSQGTPRDVGGAIVDMLYPPGTPARIPIISITGTNGKTTTTRMIDHVIRESGAVTGMTTTDGVWIAGEEVTRGDMTGPHSANVVLSDATVEVAVLETARGGIFRGGLGYDWSDVGVITNIQLDHIGQDGIETIEDIVNIKSLVAERVREGGTLIINADDKEAVKILDRPKVARLPKRIVFFSLDPANPVVRRHVESNGTAFVLTRGWMTEIEGSVEHLIARSSEIPATFGGTADFQIQNALAATAACRAYGLTRRQTAQALSTFSSDTHNAGRMNVFAFNGAHIVIDYGHNPAAFDAVLRMAEHWPERRKIGVVGVPGDRADRLICDAARAACGFDQIIVREDEDLRGRRPGEVAALLLKSIRECAPGKRCRVIYDESEAVRAALDAARPGDLIVTFCDHYDTVRSIVEMSGARPADRVTAEMSRETSHVA